MRWDGLFADLEAQAEALERAERASEVDERIRGELAQQTLADRVRAAVGTPLQLQLAGGTVASGVLKRAGAGWLLLTGTSLNGPEWLVLLPAVCVVRGLSRRAASEPLDIIESRLGIGRVFRALARDRAQVNVFLIDGTSLYGTLDRTGADFLDLAVHASGEARRPRAVIDVRVLAVDSVAALRRHDVG